ncbi:RNB-domain-containing protein [Ascodesmis nigricans]|uniref:RNB-domain-containing protein n=1 Tax=Ascodesmis nigricans TaxID=341454 RepID=A0A4S2N2B3_9PEZI|nr:RNB-domain-containing protein [Ascodesmis nigricans]
MTLPRRIPLLPRRLPSKRPFVCFQCRLLSNTSLRPNAEVHDPEDTSKGEYVFVGGRRVWKPADGIRARMEQKEREIREKLANDLRPQLAPQLHGSQAIGSGLGVADIDAMEDWEEEMISSLSGFQRMKLGELAELRSSSGLVQLGIFIQNAASEDQLGNAEFLTIHGIVRMHFSSRVMFSVPDFIPADELAKFKKTYDMMDERLRAQLASGTQGDWVMPPDISGPLVTRMREFQKEAKSLYFANATRFGQLYDRLANQENTVEITTAEVAEIIFGKNPTVEQKYATHAALTEDGLRFTGDKGYHRYTSKWRIRSKKDLAMISTVTGWLRSSQDAAVGKTPNVPPQLDDFIKKASQLIDMSRQKIAEGHGKAMEETELPDFAWTKFDRMVIDYMKTRLKGYGMQRTPLDGLTPHILRKTGRYPDQAFDGSQIFNFLTEIGAYKPWENTALHAAFARAPAFGMSVAAKNEQNAYDKLTTFEKLKLTDSMKGLRKDWGDLTVYAVDDADAMEIDDGISIEKISDTESWVHVHVANPTSHLKPDHWISTIAKNRATTLYAKPYIAPMLPTVITGPLGITKDSPVFTISTKINHDTGEVLDFTVQNGIARRVVRITYKQFEELVGTVPNDFITISSGYPPLKPREEPPLPDLSEKEMADLKHLHHAALNLMRSRVLNGMIFFTGTNHASSISHDPNSFPLTTANSTAHRYPVLYSAFPSITTKINTVPNPIDSNSVVAEFMILANSTVAKFSAKHSIPMPFRVAELDPTRPDIHDTYHNQLLPSRDEFGLSPLLLSDTTKFFTLGVMKLQAEKGPQVFMGLSEGYVRATSPLRRFADCIAHWNIEAFLRTGSIDNVPFPLSTLEIALPQLDMRERMNSFASGQSEDLLHGIAIGQALKEYHIKKDRGEEAVLPWQEVMQVSVTKWGMKSGGSSTVSQAKGYTSYLAGSVKLNEMGKSGEVIKRAREAGKGRVWARVKGFNVAERMLEMEVLDVVQ